MFELRLIFIEISFLKNSRLLLYCTLLYILFDVSRLASASVMCVMENVVLCVSPANHDVGRVSRCYSE